MSFAENAAYSLQRRLLKILKWVLITFGVSVFLGLIWSQTKILTWKAWGVLLALVLLFIGEFYVFTAFFNLKVDIAQVGQGTVAGAQQAAQAADPQVLFVIIGLLIVDSLLLLWFHYRLVADKHWIRRLNRGTPAMSLVEQAWRLEQIQGKRNHELLGYQQYATDTNEDRYNEINRFCKKHNLTPDQLASYAGPEVSARFKLIEEVLTAKATNVRQLMTNFHRLADEYYAKGLIEETGSISDLLESWFTQDFTRAPERLQLSRFLALPIALGALALGGYWGYLVAISYFNHVGPFFSVTNGVEGFDGFGASVAVGAASFLVVYGLFILVRFFSCSSFVGNFVSSYFEAERETALQRHRAEYVKLLRDLMRRYQAGRL